MVQAGGSVTLLARTVALCACLLAALAVAAAGDASGRGRVHFAAPILVDRHLAGGEPLVIYDRRHHTLVYTSHEGTTHLYRGGLVNSFDFESNYRNQVNVWVSRDGGRKWKRDDFQGTGFTSNPGQNQGFSDPDLTMDAGGRIYDTGIDLANDALFSSNDGGVRWDRGTAQCHDGDRPWLAGGKRNEVFMATDTQEGVLSHQIFRSADGGQTCSTTGIPDAGSTADGGSYSGFGKLLYDRRRDRLIEPVVFTTAHGNIDGVGSATWRRGQPAFAKPVRAATSTLYAHWPAISEDRAGNVYMVWDTDPRAPNTTGGCGGANTPLPNQVLMAVSHDFGRSWSAPMNIGYAPHARVYWPWVTAGKRGRVSVVWYQTNKLVDLDCQPGTTRIYEATVQGAAGAHPNVQVVNASGGPIHTDSVCQGGTACVATGQDRRLGDFFTNATDSRGCVLIASGDTMHPAPDGGPRPISLPILLRQNRGPGLFGRSCGPRRRR